MKRATARIRHSGLTLVELMIAMTLGLLVVAIVGSIYLGSSRSFGQDERVSAMGDELRFGLTRISHDIEMAGFFGSVIDPRSLTRYCLQDPNSDACAAWDDFVEKVADCGSSSDPVFLAPGRPIQMRNNAATADISALFTCIDAGEVQPSTAAISVARVAARRLALGDLVAGLPYLQAAGSDGALFIAPANGDAPNLLGVPIDEAEYWLFQPVVYYVRRHTVGDDGVPSLCRKRLQMSPGNLRPVTDCFAIGLQDLHLEFGIDADMNGSSNFFTSTPTAAQLDRVAMVRVHALARAERADGTYRNVKSFRLGDKVIAAPDDNFYRRTTSQSVSLRNPASQRLLR